jgi:hypothetical protein
LHTTFNAALFPIGGRSTPPRAQRILLLARSKP